MGTLRQTFNKVGLKVRKNSSKIYIGASIVMFGAAIGVAIYETMTVKEKIEKSKEDITDIKLHYAEDEEYTEVAYRKDLSMAYAKMGGRVIGHYGWTIGLFAGATFCELRGFTKEHKMAVEATVALAGLTQELLEYRERVAAAVGEEVEQNLYYNINHEVVEISATDEKGKTKKSTMIKKTVLDTDHKHCIFFTNDNKYWDDTDRSYMLLFLKTWEDGVNNNLRLDGLIFEDNIKSKGGFTKNSADRDYGFLSEEVAYIDFGLDENNVHYRDFCEGIVDTFIIDLNKVAVAHGDGSGVKKYVPIRNLIADGDADRIWQEKSAQKGTVAP